MQNAVGQTADGTPLQVSDCNASTNPWQQWILSADMETGAAIFKNVASGKCMDDSGTTNAGATPQVRTCFDTPNQLWRMAGGYWRLSGTTPQTHDKDAYVLLAGNGATNTALDSGGNDRNGSKLRLASAADNDVNNRVHILPGSLAGTWIIKFVGGNGNKCLNNPNGQTANATKMQTWDCTGGTNQNWIITNSPTSGSLNIKNQQSGKCLNDSGVTATSTNADGSKPHIWDCDDTLWAQHWSLVTF